MVWYPDADTEFEWDIGKYVANLWPVYLAKFDLKWHQSQE